MEKKDPKENLIPCEHCGHMIARDAKFCPNCGGTNKKRMSTGKIVLIAICLVLEAYFVFALSSSFVS